MVEAQTPTAEDRLAALEERPGKADNVYLACAVRHGLIRVTKDPDDFRVLHRQESGHHGIFGIYQDNDVTRDRSDAEVVAAIGRIEATVPHGYPSPARFTSSMTGGSTSGNPHQSGPRTLPSLRVMALRSVCSEMEKGTVLVPPSARPKM